MTAAMLAHGGTGGAIAEVAFVLLPVAAFFVLSRWSKRRDQAERDPGSGPDGPEGPSRPLSGKPGPGP